MNTPYAYPLMLDVTDRLCVIVGGGSVAARKARGLIAAGGKRIRVIATEFRQEMPVGVECVKKSYQPQDLAGAGLVFAATDSPQVNDEVVRDARAAGLLVNRADVDEELPGDFTTPAQLLRGPVIVTVSTAGSPALAAVIRDELANHLDPQWQAMAQAMVELRPMLREKLSASRRREAFRALASEEAIAFLGAGGVDAVLRWLVARYPELK